MKVPSLLGSKLPNRSADVPTTVTAIEDTLIRSCVAGDSDAWRAMHRRYYPVAVAFLRKLGARESDIEDACQEVFVELVRYLPTFRGQADLKTWLYRLCVTQARRVRSRSRTLRLIREHLQSDAAPEPTVPPATVTESTMVERLASTLDKMNEGDRLVFVLYEFEELSMAEIAEVLDIPAGTVASRLRRARVEFRARVSQIEVESSRGDKR